jgi:hypothetical protein
VGVLPDDPAAAAEELQRRREEVGYSYFVVGADCTRIWSVCRVVEVDGRLAGTVLSQCQTTIPSMAAAFDEVVRTTTLPVRVTD